MIRLIKDFPFKQWLKGYLFKDELKELESLKQYLVAEHADVVGLNAFVLNAGKRAIQSSLKSSKPGYVLDPLTGLSKAYAAKAIGLLDNKEERKERAINRYNQSLHRALEVGHIDRFTFYTKLGFKNVSDMWKGKS